MRLNKGIIIGGSLLLIIIIATFAAPLLTSYDPLDINIANRLSSPSSHHIFGTDAYGRDLFSRVLFGGQSSFRIGLVTVALSTILGSILGMLTGYYHKVDLVVMRFIDGFMAFPVIILALAIMACLGQSELNTVLALTVVYIPGMTRIIRSAVFTVKGTEYIESARALGASNFRILFIDIFPNVTSPLIVQATQIFAYAVLAEAGLSFLGLGTPPPAPSWGNILSEARGLMDAAPWMTLFSGLFIFFTVLGLNLLGDGLRDKLDPKMLS
jgi:peptide/nickel transport system permease protein